MAALVAATTACSRASSALRELRTDTYSAPNAATMPVSAPISVAIPAKSTLLALGLALGVADLGRLGFRHALVAQRLVLAGVLERLLPLAAWHLERISR